MTFESDQCPRLHRAYACITSTCAHLACELPCRLLSVADSIIPPILTVPLANASSLLNDHTFNAYLPRRAFQMPFLLLIHHTDLFPSTDSHSNTSTRPIQHLIISN